MSGRERNWLGSRPSIRLKIRLVKMQFFEQLFLIVY